MNLKKKAISGVKWSFAQQFSVHFINFGVQVLLARLLLPEMFGLIAMVVIFVSIGWVLSDSGMTSSLIRTKDPDQLDYSTVFFTNLSAAVVVYLIVFSLAPSISSFYSQPELVDIIRVLSLSFIIKAFSAVHIAKMTKEMDFKGQMKLQVPSVMVAGVAGVVLAYKGYGVWSLVWLNLIQALTLTVQHWLFVSWRPSFAFDYARFLYHFKFGYKLTLSSLIDVIYNDSYRIVIGKFYSPVQVGYFNHAETMRLFPVQQISTVVGKVTYPYFSKIDNDDALRSAYRKTMKLVTFISVPTMLYLILVAQEGFALVFGENWAPAAIYFQILALASIVRPVSAYNLNILKVKGKSGLLLWVEVIKKIIGAVLLVGGVMAGVLGLVVSLVVFSYFSYFVNMMFSGREINYPALYQLKDLAIIILSGGAAFIVSYFFKVLMVGVISSDLFVILGLGLLFSTIFLIMALSLDDELRSILRGLKT